MSEFYQTVYQDAAVKTREVTTRTPRLGCYPQSSAEYHASDAIGATGLKTFRRSRREFFLGISKEPTPDMDTGTLAHAALLEPDKVTDLFPIYPAEILAKKDGKVSADGAISTNAAKDWRDAHRAAGRIPVKQEQFDRVAEMVKSIKATLAPWLVHDAICEHSIYWVDEETGLLCKCRPDFLVRGPRFILVMDLKTTDDPTPAQFAKRVGQIGHWIQPPHYMAGVKATFGDAPEFIFAAQENDYPFRCVTHELRPSDLEAANSARRKHLDGLAECKRSGNFADNWDGKVNALELKPWDIS